jgi:hypothetical protein
MCSHGEYRMDSDAGINSSEMADFSELFRSQLIAVIENAHARLENVSNHGSDPQGTAWHWLI